MIKSYILVKLNFRVVNLFLFWVYLIIIGKIWVWKCENVVGEMV